MSFSSDIKKYLVKIKPGKCCAYAQLYGMLLFSRYFTNTDVFYKCDNEEICDKCMELIRTVYGFRVKKEIIGGNFCLSGDIINTGTLYADIITTKYLTDIFTCDNCLPSFMRGAFLSAGTITDPKKEFHAEVKIKDETVAISINTLLSAKNFNSHISRRGAYSVVYFKGSESVSDFVTFIGDTNKSLEIIEAGIYRDMRSRVNRIKNCETANIGKTVDAVIKQKNAISKLKKCGALENLSEELQLAAQVRLDNPEMSLSELSKLCGVSRSGLNHRFNKLIELSAQSGE